MIESLLTIAGGVVIGIWMYKKGYKKGYRDGYDTGAVDGYGFRVISVKK